MVVGRSAAEPPHLLLNHHPLYDSPRYTSPGDSELRLFQERVKYAMLGGSEVVVRTSIVSYVKRSMVHRPLPLARSPSIFFRIDVRGAAQVVGSYLPEGCSEQPFICTTLRSYYKPN